MSHTPVPEPTEGREHRVLVLGTGGTIASERTAEGFKPLNEKKARDAFYRRIARHPQLSDADACGDFDNIAATKVGRNTRYPPLRTPSLDEHGNTVVYEILDLEHHMDSSEMTPKDWNIIAALLHENWDNYEGFVVLSGTDTLAYTASVLTFLFVDAGKPITVTGAQIPLREARSDGWYNLLESLIVAGCLPYAGVGVCFNHEVLQGCRATKSSPNLLHAFETPSVAPWIRLNVRISAPRCDKS
jgi:lysophospholipase